MGNLDDLIQLIPPPGGPVDPGGDWQSAEKELGLVLPPEFKALAARYGAGNFDDISLLSPGELVVSARDLLGTAGAFRDDCPEMVPFALWPEPGGVLEWARTGNGDSLCWLTEGEPEDWTTVVWNPRAGSGRYPLGAVAFLCAYFGGRLDVPLLGPPPPEPWFDSRRDRSHVYVKLSAGELPYEQRLGILRDTLSPTADRGFHDEGEGNRQYHFKACDRDWLLTYEDCYGHQIRVAFPPEDDGEARAVILGAVEAMGCQVLRVMTIEGKPAWLG
ncbi:SMI1/KNR4 family protein [Amycolatopsis thailandensis]|uniref:SMI1/KNR4 family protein n=1 Tax=Amycolatopsis thailandensis TaxID=589330 RepID=A0A229SCW9_9PSEU|nr:SMI1/KNR4 family protein [Amycolatopsis thailandensis]OXM56773.1 SMI1/KNR4 family protein [Amycolatopsis thailandensis]